MPRIHRYICNECEFELPTGWGSYTFAVNDAGERIVCGHPGEFTEVRKITGKHFLVAMFTGRAGVAVYHVCRKCLAQFALARWRDAKRCPECRSRDVKSLWSLVGKPCPKCKQGIIKACSPIRWQLDDGWESLPVPEIVKDMVEYEQSRKVPVSLKAALAASFQGDERKLYCMVGILLNWWEGEYFPVSEPDEVIQIHSDLAARLPTILEVTPELAKLITQELGYEDDYCRFSGGLSSDVRQGIKNYVRKHREHILIS